MKRTVMAAALVCAAGFPAAAAVTIAEVAITSSTPPSRTWVASGVLEVTQGAHESEVSARNDTVRVVSIMPRRGPLRLGRETAHMVNRLPESRRADSEVIAKDIQGATNSSSVVTGIGVASFGRPLPDAVRAQSVEMRAIVRMSGRGHRLVIAQSNGPSPASTEELHEVLQEARSPQGQPYVVAVEVGKPVDQPVQVRQAGEPTSEAAPKETIVGRPGQRVIEITADDFKDADHSALVLNQASPEAIARAQAAREARDARNEEFRANREELLKADAEAKAKAESDESTQTPPAPREVKTVRRYDWRKGNFVRVPEDAPPVPKPSVATGPAGLVGDVDTNGDDETVLRGRVQRGAAAETATIPNEGRATD